MRLVTATHNLGRDPKLENVVEEWVKLGAMAHENYAHSALLLALHYLARIPAFAPAICDLPSPR